MRNTLENLQRDLSFGIESRFPDDKIFVDMNHSVPLRIMRQTTIALDLADRQIEKGRSVSDAQELRAYSNFLSFCQI